MIIKDAHGNVIGSIEFSDKELDSEKEKFEKIVEIGNGMFDYYKFKKEEHTKRMDKLITSITEGLRSLTDVIKDINKDEQYDNSDLIGSSPNS